MLDVKFKFFPGQAQPRRWMEPSPLKYLIWNITWSCNFHCKLCYSGARVDAGAELTTEEARRVIAEAHAVGVEDIIISGGEPFLRPDLVDLLAYMAELGITARIASNGTLITPQLLRRLRERTLTKSFQISVDTLDPALYASFHGCPKEQLFTALAALRAIRDAGFHATASVRAVPELVPGILALMDCAVTEGWATLTVHLPMHTGRARDAGSPNSDPLEHLRPAFEHFCALPSQWLVETYLPWATYHPLIAEYEKRIRFVHCGCRAGRDRLTIQPNGDVTPCVCWNTREACLGNVRKDRLLSLFEKGPLCHLLRAPWEYGICTDCPEIRACGGGCRATAFAATRRVDGLDPTCPLRRSGIL